MKKTSTVKNYWFLFILAIFLVLRLINLESTFLWFDDVLTLGGGERIPWVDLPLATLKHCRTISGPVFPTLAVKALSNIFGPHLFILRLPAVAGSLASLCFLYLILSKLFATASPRYFPLLLFTFSVPSIIYSQAIQPSIYYFFSTTLQLYIFIKVVQGTQNNFSRFQIARNIQILTRVSFIAFLFNYMSLIIHFLCLGYYAVLVATGSSDNPFRKVWITIREGTLDFIPLGILAYLRWRIGGHRVLYPAARIEDIGRLAYDFLSYHFNYAYSPLLYKPLRLNPVSLPFIILVALGIFYFFLIHKKHRLPALFSIVILLAGINFKIMPFGGIRHSLTLAPFAFLFAGYGIAAIQAGLSRSHLSSLIFRTLAAALILLMIVVFATSGVRLYTGRKSTLSLHQVIELARANNVTEIIGFQDTFDIMEMRNYTEGDILGRNGLIRRRYRPDLNRSLRKKYLLVAYRNAFNPDFTNSVSWTAAIPAEDFKNVNITPLKETVGPLKPDIMVQQSIYYPLNGCFIYLIEPKGNSDIL